MSCSIFYKPEAQKVRVKSLRKRVLENKFYENVFVVGAPEHRTAESLSFNNWEWNITDPYPNVKTVNSVKTISYNGIYYVFGGYANNQVSNDILSFGNKIWSRVGSLTSKRIKFSVILNADKVYIIGGLKKQKYESCTLSNTVTCEQDVGIDFQGSEEPVLLGVSPDGSCDLTFPTYESKETKELMVISNATFKEVDHFVSVQKTNHRSDKQKLCF